MLQLEVKRVRRAEAKALTSKKIVLMKLKRCKNKLAEEISKH